MYGFLKTEFAIKLLLKLVNNKKFFKIFISFISIIIIVVM